MTERDANGRFAKGESGNPKGRPPKAREERYLEIARSTVTFKQWKAIVQKAADQAERGNPTARKWLSDYLIGPPVQRTELTGADGGTLKLEYVNDWRTPDADAED